MVEQEIFFADETMSVLEILVQASSLCGSHGSLEAEKEELEKRLEEGAESMDEDAMMSLSNRLGEIYEELEDHQGSGAAKKKTVAVEDCSSPEAFLGTCEKSTVAILQGLGFISKLGGPKKWEAAKLAKPVEDLSGGWRMRLALAVGLKAIADGEADLLLLDEPTNHLDVSAMIFLELWLTGKIKAQGGSPITAVFVSHDVAFLDGVSTDIIQMENKELTYHVDMTFSEFRAKQEQLFARPLKHQITIFFIASVVNIGYPTKCQNQ